VDSTWEGPSDVACALLRVLVLLAVDCNGRAMHDVMLVLIMLVPATSVHEASSDRIGGLCRLSPIPV
jgi:hypothetical protein